MIKQYLHKIAILFLTLNALPIQAHDDANEISITTDAQYRYVRSNGIPTDHGQFPNANNPNTISAQNYSFRMPLNPQMASQVTPLEGRMDFGVGLDGVPFDPGTAEFWQGDRNWRYEALSGKINLGLDQNNAHVQPNGAYHYHGLPTDLLTDQNTSATALKLVGYAADGYPIYATNDGTLYKSSYQLRTGTRQGGPGGTYDGTFTADYMYVANSGDLDECNGRSGITSEYPQGTYYYYITYNFPIVPRCFKGIPDQSFYKEMGAPTGGMGGPQGGQRMRPRPSDRIGPPPRGGNMIGPQSSLNSKIILAAGPQQGGMMNPPPQGGMDHPQGMRGQQQDGQMMMPPPPPQGGMDHSEGMRGQQQGGQMMPPPPPQGGMDQQQGNMDTQQPRQEQLQEQIEQLQKQLQQQLQQQKVQ